jgi:hypothetical protein
MVRIVTCYQLGTVERYDSIVQMKVCSGFQNLKLFCTPCNSVTLRCCVRARIPWVLVNERMFEWCDLIV